MYCWSCGAQRKDPAGSCNHCGAPASRASVPARGHHGLRVCTGCGYRGEGIPYFRRAGHVALLVGAAVLTYGIGGVVYWLVKRHAQVCPSCGISWDRSRPLGTLLSSGSAPDSDQGRSEPAVPVRSSGGPPLPSTGMTRRVTGAILALLAVLLLGVGLVEGEAVLGVVSLFFGLTGASTFAWGWRARQHRREAILRRLQSQVLQLARVKEGRLTATDVASELDLTLNGAERILLSLDDGFRIRSDVTDDGLLIFEFPEIQLGRTLSMGDPAASPELRSRHEG
jgi:hypothetical protein